MGSSRILKGEEDTKRIGKKIGADARSGSIIALEGDLGTGKTTLTKAIAEGLGVTEMITSPTFNIVKEYVSGRMPLYHFDVYRIDDPEDLYEIGCEEYFYGDGLCVIEWADKISSILPDEIIRITLKYGESEEERILEWRS